MPFDPFHYHDFGPWLRGTSSPAHLGIVRTLQTTTPALVELTQCIVTAIKKEKQRLDLQLRRRETAETRTRLGSTNAGPCARPRDDTTTN